jgi:hypothetical protein
VDEFHKDGIEVALAEVREPVKHMARHSGLMEKIGENQIYPSVNAAIQSLARDGMIEAFEKNSE